MIAQQYAFAPPRPGTIAVCVTESPIAVGGQGVGIDAAELILREFGQRGERGLFVVRTYVLTSITAEYERIFTQNSDFFGGEIAFLLRKIDLQRV